jgi:hypothetical protein
MNKVQDYNAPVLNDPVMERVRECFYNADFNWQAMSSFEAICILLANCYRKGYDDALGDRKAEVASYTQHLCHGPGDGELT